MNSMMMHISKERLDIYLFAYEIYYRRHCLPVYIFIIGLYYQFAYLIHWI